MTAEKNINTSSRASAAALIPFLVFIVFYFGLSISVSDFYKVPMIIAFVVASAVALGLNRNCTLNDKIDIYAKGMGDANIMIMCLIFILAGIFTSAVKGTGAVDSVIVIARSFIPQNWFLVGIFIVSCFISLAMGTSCGTIAAVSPIAVGLIKPLHIDPAMMIGAVVGGAMFGDNLSVISDTTIVATRTQGVKMRDKFLTNIKIVIPVVIITAIIYFFAGQKTVFTETAPAATFKDYMCAAPYIIILILAVVGVNVMTLLFTGTIIACAIGLSLGSFDFWQALALCGKGALGMSETLIVSMLVGGMLSVIRYNGGIDYILKKINRYISTSKGCEFGIFMLAAIIDFFTANNTVTIIITGPIAKDLSQKFNCDPKRIASILDTASCAVKGIIPYGTQILIATGIAQTAGIIIPVSSLIAHMYYPLLIGVSTLIYIAVTGKNSNNNISFSAPTPPK